MFYINSTSPVFNTQHYVKSRLSVGFSAACVPSLLPPSLVVHAHSAFIQPQSEFPPAEGAHSLGRVIKNVFKTCHVKEADDVMFNMTSRKTLKGRTAQRRGTINE